MKKAFLFALMLLRAVVWGGPHEAFKAGNAFYHKEQYAQAVAEYEKVLKSGQQSPDLHFNLGNAYYKLNKVGPAIYHYEKAIMLCPHDRDYKANLAFAQKMMIDEVRPDRRVGLEKAIAGFTGALSYNGWAVAAVLCSVLLFAGFAAYYFSRRAIYKRMFFVSMLIFAFGIAVTLGSAYAARSIYQTEKPAIVFAAVASVKSEPKANSADAFVLHEGSKVFVLEELGNWSKIALADGTDGWMEKSTFKLLK